MPRDAPAVVADAPVVPERPETRSSARASLSAAAGGGSNQRRSPGSDTPALARSQGQWRQISLEDLRRVARQQGGLLGGGPEAVAHTRRLSPARPRRWSAEARETLTVARRVMPMRGE